MPGYEAGSVYASAELDISKFEQAAGQMSAEAEKIAAAMEKASAGLDAAQANIEALSSSYQAAQSSLAAAEATFQHNTASLEEMQIAAEEAALKAASLGEAYEQAAAQFGENSAMAKMASDAYEQAAASADALYDNVEKQEVVVSKSEAAYHRAEAAVKRYEAKIDQAQGKVQGFTAEIESLNAQLSASSTTVGDTGVAMEGATETGSAMSDMMGGVMSMTAMSAARSLGTLTARTLGFNTSSAAGIVAERGFGTVLRTVTRMLSPTTISIMAAGAAAVYGAYKFYDYASGAKEAREALKQLNESAEEWEKNDVTTSYEKSNGMKEYGLSSNDFMPKMRATAEDVIGDIVKPWTDGAKETDDIVKASVASFTDGAKEVREGLEEIQVNAKAAGLEDVGLFGDIDGDLKLLDDMDKRVEELLKKRQNGFLTADEQNELRTLYGEREAIKIKYQLVEDDTAGFDGIIENVEARMSRMTEHDSPAEAWAAAAQGVQSWQDNLNEAYDQQYKTISLMVDGVAKEQALNDLRAWYDEQVEIGNQAYKETLNQAAEMTSVFAEGGEYQKTADGIQAVLDAMKSGDMSAVNEALAGLDETQVVELTAALSLMEQAGAEIPESMQGTLDALDEIKQQLSGGEDLFGDSFDALNKLFGEGLDEEVLQISAKLNTEVLEDSYTAWANGEHADILASLNTSEIDDYTLDGLTGHVTAVTGDGQTFTIESITIDPLTGHVTAVTADGQTIAISDITLTPLTGKVTAVTGNGETFDIQSITINPLTGEVTGITGNGETLVITNYSIDPVTGTISGVTGDGQTFTVTDYTLNDFTGTLGGVDSKGTPYEVEGLELAEIEGVLSRVTVGENTIIEPIEVPVVYSSSRGEGLSDLYEKASDAVEERPFFGLGWSDSDKVLEYADAVRELNEALASGDDDKINSAWQDIENIGYLDAAGLADSAKLVSSGMQMLADGNLSEEDAAKLFNYISALETIAQFESEMGGDFGENFAEAFAGLSTIDGTVFEGLTGDDLGQTLLDSLNAITAQFPSAGASMIQGTASGAMGAEGELNGAMQEAAQDARDTFGAAIGEGSPAELFKPAGASMTEGVAEGIPEGMSAVSSAMTQVANGAVQAARSRQSQLVTVGRYMSTGLAMGIRQNKDQVINAMKDVIEAAIQAGIKAAQIGSPSKVTAEMGYFLDMGFVEGLKRGAPQVSDALNDALRLEAPAGAAYRSGYDTTNTASRGAAFDYDRLESIVQNLNMVMVANDKVMAQVTARQNQMQSENAAKRLALATGRR